MGTKNVYHEEMMKKKGGGGGGFHLCRSVRPALSLVLSSLIISRYLQLFNNSWTGLRETVAHFSPRSEGVLEAYCILHQWPGILIG